MRPNKPQVAVVVAAWVAILCLIAFIVRAEDLPRTVNQQQSSICRVGPSTGVYIGDGVVVCAAHTVRGDRDGLVPLTLHGGGRVIGKIVEMFKTNDLAHLKIIRGRVNGLKGIRLSVANPTIGETVWRAGYVPDGRLLWHRGKVLSVTEQGKLVITPFSIGGQSGGPILNARGRLVGILYGSKRGKNGDNTTACTSIERIRKLLGIKTPVEEDESTAPRFFQRLRKGSCRVGEPCPAPGGITAKNLPEEIEVVYTPPEYPSQGNCSDAELAAQRAAGEAEKNRNELLRHTTRLANLESTLKETQLALQRTVGVVAVLRKELTLQTNYAQAKSGTLAFRMVLDRSGNVVKVIPR